MQICEPELKECSCYDVLVIFSSQQVLETSCDVQKDVLVSLQIFRQLSGFLNNLLRVLYPVKLKISMLYHLNIFFSISVDAPLSKNIRSSLKYKKYSKLISRWLVDLYTYVIYPLYFLIDVSQKIKTIIHGTSMILISKDSL